MEAEKKRVFEVLNSDPGKVPVQFAGKRFELFGEVGEMVQTTIEKDQNYL